MESTLIVPVKVVGTGQDPGWKQVLALEKTIIIFDHRFHIFLFVSG